MRTRAIAGVPDQNADLLHATGFSCPDLSAWFQVRGRGYLLVNDLEILRARREARVAVILPLSRFYERFRRQGTPKLHPFRALAAALRERNVLRVDVPSHFPAGALESLADAGIRARVLPDPFLPDRFRKSPREVRKISAVLRAAEAGMTAGVLALRKSRIGRDGFLYLEGHRLTSEALRERIESAIFAAGAIPTHTIVAGGAQAADPHSRGSGPLRARRPIVLDLFPRSRSTHYYADITRTVVKGRADDRTRAAFLAVLTAQELACEMVRAGVDGSAVHRRVCAFFGRTGFPASTRRGVREGFFHGTGHGLGLELHEYPHVSNRRCPLEEGHVITVEPGLYYRNLGGIRIEDVVLVTRTGCVKLSRFPVFLEIP